LFKKFLNKSWSVSLLKLGTKIDQIGTVDRKPGSGKKCETRIADNIASVKELALCQKNALKKRRTFGA